MRTIFLVVLFTVAASVSGQGVESVFLAIERYLQNVGNPYREECIKSSMVDPQLVLDLEQKAMMAEDRKLKCYLECQYLNTNVIDKQGIINIEGLKVILEASNQDFIDEIEKQCKHPRSTDVCEAAYEGTVCVFKILAEKHHLH